MKNSIYPIISIVCFIAAICFYRKKDVPIGRVIPFLVSSMSPHQMTKVLEKEGVDGVKP